ncbi:MAG: sigma-70 family RNA polymerase sigma factor [candidate division Zixibacteria bacterium]|nr:sigma-70 family RNA polymerase sigma factor [candidate division Zixibacteria bacterium]
MPDIDRELIKRALSGNQDAYKELMNRHRPATYHIIFKFVREKEAAADLVQETFMKAFASLNTYRSEYKFSTWLYRIAANSAIDYLRKQRIHTLSLDSPGGGDDDRGGMEIVDLSYHPEKDLEEREKRISIQDAINSLPEKYRMVILYRHKEDRSYEEIAEALNIPIGTVKARIFRARELLKKKLKPF